jgi:hypothetical protein
MGPQLKKNLAKRYGRGAPPQPSTAGTAVEPQPSTSHPVLSSPLPAKIIEHGSVSVRGPPLWQRPLTAIDDAPRFGGPKRSLTCKMIADGRLETVKVGRRRFIKTASLLKVLGLSPSDFVAAE